jgi:hypothetical protein
MCDLLGVLVEISCCLLMQHLSPCTQLDRITKQEFAKLEKKLGEDEGKGDDTAKESSVA